MLPDLAFRITAQAATAQAFAKVKTDVTATTAAMQKFSTVGKALFAGFGAAGLVELGRGIRDVVKDIGDLVDEADKLGIGPKRLDELRYAAEKVGTSVGTLDAALEKFNANIALAAAGKSGDFATILKENGVALTDTAGKQRSFNDLLDAYANLIRNAKNESDRLLLVQLGFGEGANDLVNMLAKGKEGLDAATAAHDKLSAASDEDFRRLKDIDEAWDDLAKKLSYGIRGAIVVTVSGLGQGRSDPFNTMPGVSFPSGDIGALAGASVNTAPKGDFAGFASQEAAARAARENAALLGDVQGQQTKIDLDTKAAAEADRKRKQYEAVIKALELERTNLTATNREQEINNALSKAGVDATSAWGQKVTEAAGALHDQREAIKANADAMQFFGEQALDAWDTLIPKINTGNDALDGFLNTLIHTVAQAGLLGQGPLAGALGTSPTNAGGVGGLFGQLLGGLQLNPVGAPMNIVPPGFAAGGSGIVGGAGGTDSQIFMARATPGEPFAFGDDAVRGIGRRGGDGLTVQTVTRVDRDGNLRSYVERISGRVAGQTIQYAAPGLAQQGAAASMGSLASGKGDAAMAKRFRLAPAAPSR